MNDRGVIRSSFEEYLDELDFPAEIRAAEILEREQRLARFPFSTVLQVHYPIVAFINRWCWQHFGPADGNCSQSQSEYRACHQEGQHSHAGAWLEQWLEKTDYNFGYCEWLFREVVDHDLFVANLSEFHWGENYPE